MPRTPLLLTLPLVAVLGWFLLSPGSPTPSAEPPPDTSAAAASAATIHAAESAPVQKPQTWNPDEELAGLKVAPGYEINLFASEREFPELVKPVAITFDARNRLWVSTMPSYPQYVPGVPPDDKLLILEDTKHAGRADKCTVFADKLYLPTGFELGDGGAYVAQQPDLMFLRDTHGGDKADERRVVLHGFGTEDSHHAIHAFTWGPDGGLYFQEGTFFHSQIETPHGPVRLQDSGVYRFLPRPQHLEVFVSYYFANPWGHTFDRWGQDFIADASGGENYFAAPITGRVEHPYKHPAMKVFTSVVRPTCGCELVSSRQFPDSAQGNFLVNNNIGFQGIKQHRVIEEGSGFTSKEIEPLLFSSDPNFRPVALKFGPDGALYVADWFNPIIGHMQYSLRDPRRDHGHGRIWRITYKGRPPLEPPKIAGQPIPALLDLLKTYEDRTRYVVRRELRDRPADEVAAALKTWIAGLDAKEADYQHNLLEALWVYQTIDVYEPALLKQLLRSPDYHVRAAATRALRHSLDRVDNPLALLKVQANDEHPRVRLEAVLACSFIPKAEAAEVALESLKHPTDYYLDYGLKETIRALQPHWQPAVMAGHLLAADNPAGIAYLLAALDDHELTSLAKRIVRSASTKSWLILTWEESLSRGSDRQSRLEALQRLAKLTGRSKAEWLVRAPAKSRFADNSEVAHLLPSLPAEELKSAKSSLYWLATNVYPRHWRQSAIAAIAVAEGPASTWSSAKGNDNRLIDLLAAIDLIDDPKLRDPYYTRVVTSIRYDLTSEMPRSPRANSKLFLAEIDALARFPGHGQETFELLAQLLNELHEETAPSPEIREYAQHLIAAVRRIPKADWQLGAAHPPADAVLAYVAKEPIAERDTTSYADALQVGRDLTALLPAAEREAMLAKFDELVMPTITIRSVHDMIQFDRPRFYVQAGRPVEIVFQNTDIMPHNLLIARPGSLEEIGLAAEKMSARPDATARNFLPESSKVIAATKLVQATQSEKLLFVAPTEPGDYPYLCTFPGHWRRMNGVMEVVPDLKKALRDRPLPDPIPQPKVRPFIQNWKTADLAPLLRDIDRGCSIQHGRELFAAASCIKCHKIRGEGGVVGPDLTDVAKRLKPDEILPRNHGPLGRHR